MQMKNGSTVHRGFKLPVSLVESSVSGIIETLAETETLRQLIIIVEITILPKDKIRSSVGTVIVIGGDFRPRRKTRCR
jgi:hypothetical protein